MQYCIVTPINLTARRVRGNAAAARRDYRREEAHFGPEDDFNPKWDDSKANNAVVGDKFAFVQNTTNIMEIFTIIGIIPADNRPGYWDLPEHQRRRVLILSKLERKRDFREYKNKLGYSPGSRVQGTFRWKWEPL